jgi:uncharacterized protein YcaQ
MPDAVSAAAARTLLLSGQGLLDDPDRRPGPVATERLVRALGFVQIDSIQRVERAHHLILGTRLQGYRPAHLDQVAFGRRTLFEHWTHDAALIPLEWYPHWQRRFRRRAETLARSRWYQTRLGATPERMLAHVRDRIEREGPLSASDFPATERTGKSAGWWDWSPEKAALEFLWHTGVLAVRARVAFRKVYDLVERVFPDVVGQPVPDDEAHVDWAAATALDRLGVATPGELSAYFAAIDVAAARAWCTRALASGQAVAVTVHAVDGSKPRAAVAVPDWARRVARAAPAPDVMRALAPFDPVLRDRARLGRLFGFDYRFEAFVPESQRQYGYYVLPLLDRERMVGRIDPRFDRPNNTLVVDAVWWEPDAGSAAGLRKRLEAATERLAERIGADRVALPVDQARARSTTRASRSSSGSTTSASRSGKVKTSSSKP